MSSNHYFQRRKAIVVVKAKERMELRVPARREFAQPSPDRVASLSNSPFAKIDTVVEEPAGARQICNREPGSIPDGLVDVSTAS